MDKPVADFYKPQEKLEELKVQILEAQKRRLNERIRELEQQNQIHMQELVRQMQVHMTEQVRVIKASSLPAPLQAYVPDYQPVIKALKQLVKAFEVVDNRGTTPLHTYQEEHKKRSDATKKRHAATPPEKRKASTLPARMARIKAAKERRERLYSSTVTTKS